MRDYLKYVDYSKKNGSFDFYVIMAPPAEDIAWAWLRNEDGDLLKVTVERDEWPITIGGVDIEELLDGIRWAG